MIGKFSGFKLAVILTALVAVFFLTMSDRFELYKFLELKTLDMRFNIRGEIPSSDDVIIAVVDDQSIDALGRWPWPRSYFGSLIDSLNAAGAKVIGFDIIFSEPEENPLYVTISRLKSYYDTRDVPRLGSEAREFGDVLGRILMEIPHSDQMLADAMNSHGSIISTLVFYSFKDKEADEASSLDRVAEEGELPPADLLKGSGGPEGMDLPPEDELLLLDDDTGDSLPDDLLGEDMSDAFLPEVVRQEHYRHFVGDAEMFDVPDAKGILLPLEMFVDASGGFGFVNFTPDIDGGLRWEHMVIKFLGKYYPPIGIRMLMEYWDLGPDDLEVIKGRGIRLGDTIVPTDSNGNMLVNYYGPYGSIKYYSIVDIIDGNFPPDTFKDKIVLIGGAATGLGDVWLTPFDPSMPGVEKHATVLSNILQGDFIKRPPSARFMSLMLIVVAGLALGFYIPRMSSVMYVFVFTSLVLFVVVGVVVVMFTQFGIWVNLVYPVSNLCLVSLGVVVYQYFTEEREKRQIKKAFKMYLNDALVEQLAESHEGLKLGGEEKELTVLFSDIRNFTGISEGLSPERLVSLINIYLSLMTKTIMNENGTVDKYIGDAIMAIYGAPIYSEDHPAHACRTALKMMSDLHSNRHNWIKKGFPEINIGIGINTGPMVVGNMGSEDRFDYTVMGDSVNLASRLEGLTKAYGTGIIVSEYTAEKIASDFILKDIDLVRVKGKDRPIRIFELIGEGAPDKALSHELEAYTEALDLYRNMRWQQALGAFEELSREYGSQLYGIYSKRCVTFMAEPPEGEWDGVYTFTTK